MAKQINFNGYLIRRYGAYIRTDISSLVDINGVASGIIGIVGLSEIGPEKEPVTINGYKDLVQTFGDGPLVRHGLAAYVGGAQTIVCVRIGNPDAAQLSATQLGANESKSYTFVAREKGTFGNDISVAVETIDIRSNTPAQLPIELDKQYLLADDYYRVQVRYSSKRVEEEREVFLFPRYMPLPTDRKGNPLFYADNGKDFTDTVNNVIVSGKDNSFYYLLRDREQGYIRDIPRVWSYGVKTKEEFIKKVDELKSASEDLITFPAWNPDGTRTFYPLAIMQQVINEGGMGYAPSEFVKIKNVEPNLEDLISLEEGETLWSQALAETLIEHPFVQFSGGKNGDDGTGYYEVGGDPTYTSNEDAVDTWNEGLALLEEEDINFVQPAYLFNEKANNKAGTTWVQRYGFFKTVTTQVVRHVRSCSNTVNRQFRTSIVGVPWFRSKENAHKDADDFLKEIMEISGLVNDDRIQLWVGGFRSRSFSNKREDYGADMLASFVAGLHAARNPEDSITFLQISGIFTDGLEFYFNSTQKHELYGRSMAHVMRRRNSTGATEFVAAHNMTSWTGASNRGIQLFITRRIVDYMNTYVYRNLEDNFIGRKSLGAATSRALESYTNTLLSRLVAEGKLVAYADVLAAPAAGDPTVYEITFRFQPVSEIDFILVTNTLTYSLA